MAQGSHLGLSAIGWHAMTDSWWNKFIAFFLLATIIIGSIYLLFRAYWSIKAFWIRRQQRVTVPKAVTRYLARLRSSVKPLTVAPTSTEELKSFGVYLGSFASPATPAQTRLLSEWDVVVLDPLATGVSNAVTTCAYTSPHVLGRIDVAALVKAEQGSGAQDIVKSIRVLDETITMHFRNGGGSESPFTAVLLANFSDHYPAPVFNELVNYINELGLGVWIEMSPPAYMSTAELRAINMKAIRGVVYRNGTIRPDGDWQNFHQMEAMRTAMRAVAAQRVPSGPPMALWETTDDGVPHQYAVIQRTFIWCRFTSSLCWIGSRSSLTNADVAAKETISDKPLGALMWMKDDLNMKAHNIWCANDQINSEPRISDELYDTLNDFIPDLADKLRFQPSSYNQYHSLEMNNTGSVVRYSQALKDPRMSPLSRSSDGADYTGLGCFQLGLEATPDAFDALVASQIHLKDLELLQRLKIEDLQAMRTEIQVLRDVRGLRALSSTALAAVDDLVSMLDVRDDQQYSRLEIFSGLHSGFQTGADVQFWGLFDFEGSSGGLDIYLSNFTHDRAATVLHTFLSSRGCTRAECFMAEFAMAEQNATLNKKWQLPERIVHDIMKISPTEALLLRQRLTVSIDEDSFILARMRALCEYQLVDIPSVTQLRLLNAKEYLAGRISADSLVSSRLNWLQEKGWAHTNPMAAIQLFTDVQTRLHQILMNGESEIYGRIGTLMRATMQKDGIDAGADLLALATFCAFRKLAFDETFYEILDRNPFPNHATDQAGVFAENFLTGSRTDSFFDITPRQLGKILSDRYRPYYNKFQPPDRIEGYTELPTTYAPMQVDSDVEYGNENLSTVYKFTFLGIFAVPALIDIFMLTTIGRGLYLTTFMTSDQKTMATTALMLALLICGGVGSWITSGGCYYIYASAFPAMNMYVLTRFIAGLALVIVGGVVGFVVVSIDKGPGSGGVFAFYFAMLSIYLMTLSALSIYQVPGSSFKSGRTVIMRCIPILFISPVLTIWVQHDIAVYIPVLSVFVCSLLYGSRKVMAAWSTWYLNIPSIQDAEIIAWYCKKHDITGGTTEDLKALSASGVPRSEFHGLVLKEFKRKFWQSKTKDPLVAKMAEGYESTKFLMGWYCRHRRTAMPYAYSSTWNLTIRAALENITNMQKGLKLHNAFLHWRHTGSDVWSGILYFVVALMDKWATLLTSGGMVGLSAASSTEYRLAVGFGLSYYLIGAVSLDGVSQPLWTAANEKITQPILSLDSLQNVTDVDASARRGLYFRNLLKFFLLHIWGASITAALMWTFDDSANAMIMYIAYVAAYSGLLLYQYNKIYCRFDGAQSLAVASVIGLPVGIALRVTLSTWAYTGVISLGIACWISAIHSIYVTKIGWPRMPWAKSRKPKDTSYESVEKEQPAVYTCSSLEPYPALSQSTLSKSFEIIQGLSSDNRFHLKPSEHPGARVQEYLVHRSAAPRSNILHAAFPSAQQMIERTVELWSNGSTVVELVGARNFPHGEQKLRSIAQKSGDRLHILIALGPDLGEDELTMDIHRNSKIIAEAIIQATCEHHLGMSRDHSMLAQLVAVEDSGDSEVPLPENIKRHLETSASERARVISTGNKVLLRHLCLGVDPDIEWDDLHQDIRSFLLKLLSGQFDPLSSFEQNWIASRGCVTDAVGSDEFIARYDLSAALTTSTIAYAKVLTRSQGIHGNKLNDMDDLYLNDAEVFANSNLKVNVARRGPASRFIFRVTRIWKSCLKFLILSLVADPEYQRELDWMIRTQPLFIHWPVTFFLNAIWSYTKFLQNLIIPVVLFHGRANITQFQSNIQGMKTILQKNRVVVENLRGPSTCFWSRQADGSIRLSQYNGNHEKEPDNIKQLVAINTYGEKFLLQQREEYKGEKMMNMFTYEYPQGKKTNKLPIQRQCIQGKLSGEIVQYDWRGYITTGSTFRGVNPVQFTYWYRRSAKFEDELLRGEFVFPHITIRIMWSMPPRTHPERLDDWVPFPKVTEATFIEGPDVHHATWAYEHKFHPTISTTLNGVDIDTPPMIREDWFHVLEKPQKLGFLSDNPLNNFSSISSNIITRTLGLNVKRYPMSTSHARTQLWKLWKSGQSLDAVTARWLDESLLRKDSMLKSYWRNRDWGMLNRATQYLDTHADSIMARTDVDSEISAWVHVAYKMSDLYSFGSGGDTTINTRTHSGQIQDSDDELHVMAMDTSTWPYEPGGVSACRRDMVNDLKTTKWHIVAEMAHDYGVPKFQIERNVKSLTVLPLWGLDFLNPTHGMLRNTLDSEVVERSYDTRTSDIRKHFIPILTSLVQCSRNHNLTRQHLEEATKALCDLNTYFESARSWNDVWSSETVKSTWRELWLAEDVPGALNVSEWWDYEKPTMQQLDQALNLWCRYLFIFSTPVPEKIPDIFQASHHFTGATYGILCKVKRKVSLHVWDHCISFREFTVFMSSAVSFDMPFVNSSLMSLGHLACILLEHHADVVLPCCDYYNPGWEVELGTHEGVLQHRRAFARKIDPVVNGICNMDKFEPIKEIKTDTPTVVMLSHVQYVKDIKNAIMATDLIVNKWGFKDYRLHIYGDMERAAGHSTECQELIASKGLGDACVLKGLGNASLVLQDAWIFLNSSISEGLPLAMGEAALTGVPVVCTDVGASFCVVTNRTTGEPFSEVVPPNDCESLARAQVNILALLGKWAPHAEDAPGFVPPVLSYPNPSPEEVKAISARMYEKKDYRRKLGMTGRDNVLKNFNSERYLREHEQMLWVGKYRSPSYQEAVAKYNFSNTHGAFPQANSAYPSAGPSVDPSRNNSSTGLPLMGDREKKSFGLSMTSLPRVPSTPRLTPDRWSSAPSSRASSIWKFKPEQAPW